MIKEFVSADIDECKLKYWYFSERLRMLTDGAAWLVNRFSFWWGCLCSQVRCLFYFVVVCCFFCRSTSLEMKKFHVLTFRYYSFVSRHSYPLSLHVSFFLSYFLPFFFSTQVRSPQFLHVSDWIGCRLTSSIGPCRPTQGESIVPWSNLEVQTFCFQLWSNCCSENVNWMGKLSTNKSTEKFQRNWQPSGSAHNDIIGVSSRFTPVFTLHVASSTPPMETHKTQNRTWPNPARVRLENGDGGLVAHDFI